MTWISRRVPGAAWGAYAVFLVLTGVSYLGSSTANYGLDEVLALLAGLADTHRATPMLGRTRFQQAVLEFTGRAQPSADPAFAAAVGAHEMGVHQRPDGGSIQPLGWPL